MQITERMNTDVELKLQTNRILAPNSLTSWLLKFSKFRVMGGQGGGWGVGVSVGVWRNGTHDQKGGRLMKEVENLGLSLSLL